MTLSGDAVAGSCSTGLISLRGAMLGAGLGSAAVGLALITARRREVAPAVEPSVPSGN
jgi:hypothetical protein